MLTTIMGGGDDKASIVMERISVVGTMEHKCPSSVATLLRVNRGY
jgi:hypothetical protein